MDISVKDDTVVSKHELVLQEAFRNLISQGSSSL